ncbi:ribonuclease H-like domain-containing protein [Tanacetum coccineum]
MVGAYDENPPPPLVVAPTQQAPHTVSTIKLPILKKGEYNIWAMKMEHHLAHTDYPIWEVIQRENGPRERKARTTLLMAIPEDHLAKFHKMTDAKEMWDAIKSRFGGNDKSKKMQKYILKQQFEGFSVSNSEGLHKGYDRFQSLLSQLEIHGAGVSTEDANKKFLRVFKTDVKGSTGSSSSAQNVAFVSSESTSSTNDEPVGFDKAKVECFNCHKTGHFAREFISDIRRRDARNTGYKAKDNGRRPGKQEEPKALATLDGNGVDWTGHAEDEQENFALMAYSHSGLDTKVTSCSKECEESYAKLKKLYDEQREQLGDASIEIKAYTLALAKVEAQLVCHQKNQLAYEEKIRFMKIDLDDKTDVLTYHKKLLAEAVKEKEELKTKLEKWQNSSKSLNKLLDSQMSVKEKIGLGFSEQVKENELYDEALMSVFDSHSSDIEDAPVYDRFAKVEGMHAVPPPMTGNYMPPKSNFGIDESHVETLESVHEPVVIEPKVVSQPKFWFDTPIIKEYESDSDDEYVIKSSKEQETPSFAFVNTVKHVKTPRETVKEQNTCNQSPKIDKKDWNGLMSKKLGLGYGFTRKACFVCGSFGHPIRDCDFHEKRMAKQVELNKKKSKGTGEGENRPVWNNVQRLNHQNKFVPIAVLIITSRFPVNTARHNFNSQAVSTSTDKKANANDPQQTLKGKGIVDSGCSRHMSGNKAYLVGYQEFQGGSVVFGVDFLTRSSIYYSLTISPIVSTSLIEQFWNTTTSKIVNDVSYIKAKVAGKTVSLSEASIRRDLLFNDVDGIDFLTKKVFTNMAKQGLHFSSHVTPLFPNMLAQAVVDEGEGSEQPIEPQLTPSPTQPSTGDQPPIPHDSPLSGGQTSDRAEGGLNLEELSVLRSYLFFALTCQTSSFDDLDADLAHGMDDMETKEAVNEGSDEKEGSTVSTARPEVSTGRPDVGTARQEISTADPTTPLNTTTIFDDEEMTLADTLVKMKDNKAKGVVFKDIEELVRPARSILILKPLPSIDPKDKGKGVLEEPEPAKKITRSNSDAAQVARDAEVAKQLEVELQAEYTVDERAKLLAELFKRRKKQLAEESRFKHSQLNKRTLEEIQTLYIKEQERAANFVPIGSEEDERLIQKMNKKVVGVHVEKVLEEPDSTKVEVNQEAAEQGTRKTLGKVLKMKARKKAMKPTHADSDTEYNSKKDEKNKKDVVESSEKGTDASKKRKGGPRMKRQSKRKKADSDLKEEEHLKTFLKIVPDEECIIDFECIYYSIFRSDGSSRWIKTFSEMVTRFDRLDLVELYNLVMQRFETTTPEDGTEIRMLVERRYPLTKETLERMMSLKLIAESTSDSAYDLLRFIQKQIDEAGSHDGGEKDL